MASKENFQRTAITYTKKTKTLQTKSVELKYSYLYEEH